MKILFLIIINMIYFNHSIYASETFTTNSKEGKIEFLAKGPIVKVKGKGVGVNGKINVSDEMKATGELILDLNSLKTGINMRDDHMKNKYLNVKEHPDAVLSFKDVLIPEKYKGKVEFMGLLKLNDITKPVTGFVELKGKKLNDLNFNADFKIKFSDFNIAVPTFKLVSLGEEVAVKIESKAIIDQIPVKSN